MQANAETVAAAEFDHFAGSYDQLLHDPLRTSFASDPLHFWWRKWKVMHRLLCDQGRNVESMSWLDVGCGRGELLELAGAHFAQIAGCDPSVRMLERERSLPLRRQQHPTELPFPSRTFDLVTAVCVYHHVAPAARTTLTREIRRVLNPGGLFCLIEHNPFNPITRRIVNRCPVDADAKLLSSNESVDLIIASGFCQRASKYFLYLPEHWFNRVQWIENLLARIPFGGQYAILAEAIS